MGGVGRGGHGGRAILIDIATGHRAGIGEMFEAPLVGVGAHMLRVGGRDQGLTERHVGRCELLVRAERDERGPGGLDLRLGVLHLGGGGGDAGVEFFRIDPDQRIAGVDALVVPGQNRGDQSPNLGRDDRGVGLDIGRVGRDRSLGNDDVDGPDDRDEDRRADREDRATRERRRSPVRDGCRRTAGGAGAARRTASVIARTPARSMWPLRKVARRRR